MLRPQVTTLTLIVVGCLGAVFCARSMALAYDLARPVPFWDQWEFVKSFPSVLAGTFSLADLFAFHNEHRIATSRVFFILDLFYADGTSYLSNIVVYATLACIAGTLAVIADGRRLHRLAFFLIVAGFLFSPVEWENLSSGFQIEFPFVNLATILSMACLIAALDAVRVRRVALFLALALACDFLAVFSMASGALAIVPALCVGLILRPRSFRLAAYIVVHALLCALYFDGFPRIEAIPAVYDPIRLTRFVVIYLGACLRGIPHGLALVGATDLVLVLIAGAATVRRSFRSRTTLDRGQVLALSIAILMVADAYLTALARAGLDPSLMSASSSRYSLQSILLQAVLFVFFWRYFQRVSRPASIGPVLRAGAIVALTVLTVASNLSPLAIEEWRDRSSIIENAGDAMVNGVWSDQALGLVYPQPNLIAEPVRFLAAHRLGPFSLRFGGSLDPPLKALAGVDLAAADACVAQFGAADAGPRWLQLAGWAYDPTRPAGDGFVFAVDAADGDRILGFGRQSTARPDVDEALDVHVGRSGFNLGLKMPATTAPAPHLIKLVLIPSDPSGSICTAAISWPPRD